MAGISFADEHQSALMNLQTPTDVASGIPASVDSFSQLPFIRSGVNITSETAASNPTSAMNDARCSRKEKVIRLFGIEFCEKKQDPVEFEDFIFSQEHSGNEEREDGDSSNNTISNPSTTTNTNNSGGNDGGAAGKSSRKFECQYCFRNFPTSQALGGHQNAHKRERQHAKRLHLQSAMAHPINIGSTLCPLAGLMNYHHQHRLAPNRTVLSGFEPTSYSWLPNASPHTTINGSPIQSLVWRRIPFLQNGHPHEAGLGVQHSATIPLQLLAAGTDPTMTHEPRLTRQTGPTEQGKDNVSLDLHL